MRIFPRASRPRLVAASAAVTLAMGALATPLAHADDTLKHRQRHVQSQIKSADHDLDESSARFRRTSATLDAARARLGAAQRELSAVRARLGAARAYDHEMQVKLAAAVQRLSDAQAELVAGQAALDAQHAKVTDTVTSIYEQGDPQLLAFSSLLDAQTPADLSRRMEAQNVIVGNQTRAYDDLHAAEVLLQVRKDEVATARDEVAAQRRDAAAHLVTMERLHAQTVAAKVKVRDSVNSARDARSAANAARRHDQVQLHRLKVREARLHEQMLAAARRARASHGGYTGPTGGILMHPVSGPITSPFGWRIHPIYHYWGLHDGDDFGAGCNQPLYAADGGTVMSEYYSSVWGNRLYLNLGSYNGKNVTVIYNHLSRYRVGTGAHVARGEVVGYVGTTGWSTGCHLHFTVMVNGTPVDPTPWF